MTDGPYKLPPGWRWVTLHDVTADMRSGFAHRKNGTEAGDLLHLRPYNIGADGQIELGRRFYVPSEVAPQGDWRLEKGDVLFNNTNSVELVGKTALVEQSMNAGWSNHLTLLRPRANICEGSWLAKALRVLWQRGHFARASNKWIGQAGYNRTALRTTRIPLPPLDEQRRIVARIEELFGRIREARRLREEAKKDADRLMQAALAEVFPRPGSPLPPSWRWVQLQKVCEHRAGIWGPEAVGSDGFPVVRSTEIAGYRIQPDVASVRVIPQDRARIFALIPGDILVNKSSGSPHLVGWAAIFEGAPDGRVYLFSNFMFRLRTATDQLQPWFLLYYLHSPAARSMYLGAQDTTSGLRNLRVREFMALQVPLPPLEIQRRIVDYLDQVQQQVTLLKRAHEETEAELPRLEQSILDRAFRGEL